jgi:hypothetical protein
MLRLRAELVDAFRRLDTCKLSNAIETFDIRLRNEGFADPTIRGLFDDLPPVWWNYILTVPAPRVVVVEDAGQRDRRTHSGRGGPDVEGRAPCHPAVCGAGLFHRYVCVRS